MVVVGLVVTLAGWLLSVASLTLSGSAGGRLGIALAGIVISLAGILGVLNPAYQKNAIWKR